MSKEVFKIPTQDHVQVWVVKGDSDQPAAPQGSELETPSKGNYKAPPRCWGGGPNSVLGPLATDDVEE